MSVFLSIITINYNNHKGLRNTVRSVLSQTYSDYEYLVIDGASTDGSRDYLQSVNQQAVKWISEPDSGIYNAMNKGIKRATGTYLLFLNSGDQLNGKEALQSFIGHPGFGGDIVYGDYKFEQGEKRYPDVLSPGYFVKTSLPHQSTFFKRRVFEEMGFYDESYSIGADRAFFIKCYLSERYRFQHIPVFLTVFDLSGLSNDPRERALKRQEDERMLKELYGKDYEKYKAELQKELEANKIPKYSLKGILKRIKKRLNDL